MFSRPRTATSSISRASLSSQRAELCMVAGQVDEDIGACG
jgi:hypothetical protein